jgi:hypothetical protein
MLRKSTEWIEEDLLWMKANGEQESITLDFKACAALENNDAKRNDLSKDVSSFANSAGGIIIYGIKEVDRVAIDLDGGYNPATITKEWLENSIQGRINPPIQGIHVNPVQLSTHAPGKVAYVVTIPQGKTAHQAYDKRYYKRSNFKSEPMEHHEVRDVMNRLNFPLLAPRFSARFVDRTQTIYEYVLDIRIENKGPIAAHNWKIVLQIPQSLSFRVKGFDRQRGIEVSSRIYGPQWFEQEHLESRIIFPEEEVLVAGIEFVYKVDTSRHDRNESGEPFLIWKIYADNMPPQKGEVFLSSIPHPVN